MPAAGPTLDVDWRDDTSFASCSNDQTILLCKMGETKPVKTLRGHKVAALSIALLVAGAVQTPR